MRFSSYLASLFGCQVAKAGSLTAFPSALTLLPAGLTAFPKCQSEYGGLPNGISGRASGVAVLPAFAFFEVSLAFGGANGRLLDVGAAPPDSISFFPPFVALLWLLVEFILSRFAKNSIFVAEIRLVCRNHGSKTCKNLTLIRGRRELTKH